MTVRDLRAVDIADVIVAVRAAGIRRTGVVCRVESAVFPLTGAEADDLIFSCRCVVPGVVAGIRGVCFHGEGSAALLADERNDCLADAGRSNVTVGLRVVGDCIDAVSTLVVLGLKRVDIGNRNRGHRLAVRVENEAVGIGVTMTKILVVLSLVDVLGVGIVADRDIFVNVAAIFADISDLEAEFAVGLLVDDLVCKRRSV